MQGIWLRQNYFVICIFLGSYCIALEYILTGRRVCNSKKYCLRIQRFTKGWSIENVLRSHTRLHDTQVHNCMFLRWTNAHYFNTAISKILISESSKDFKEAVKDFKKLWTLQALKLCQPVIIFTSSVYILGFILKELLWYNCQHLGIYSFKYQAKRLWGGLGCDIFV